VIGDPVPIDESLAAGGQGLYLTFDDGPNPEWTPQILDVMAPV
jgi:peptidoglycan/xylan/chitin deacetylase (PgdA/CDA1 family)